VAAKVAELRDLQGKMADSASALQAAEKDKAALGVKIDTLSSQLAAREKERSADAAARQRLESELDDLRKVMAAKSSEDIKRQEADRSREAEMSRLREQVAAAQKGLDDQISQSQKLSEKLRVDFEGIASAYKAAQGEVTSLKSAIASKEKEADAARLDKERYAREARESRDELGRVQDRIKSLDGELSAMGVVRDVSSGILWSKRVLLTSSNCNGS
jgi:myosin protein heavy chain